MSYQSSAKQISEYSTTEYVIQTLGKWRLLQRCVNSICKMRWFQRQGA